MTLPSRSGTSFLGSNFALGILDEYLKLCLVVKGSGSMKKYKLSASEAGER